MTTATALAHTPFMAMLTDIKQHGETTIERELAGHLQELYSLVDENPRVVNYINEWALRIMS